jgi:hypothetical protein
MAVNAPKLLQQKWPILTRNGLTKTCLYRERASASYSPTTGVVTQSTTSSHTLEILFDQIRASLVDGSTVLSIDRWAIFPALNLPVVPKVDDVIVAPNSREWVVKDVVEDPADASYSLRVRPQT